MTTWKVEMSDAMPVLVGVENGQQDKGSPPNNVVQVKADTCDVEGDALTFRDEDGDIVEAFGVGHWRRCWVKS